ncbi:MAG: MCE family protein [Gemmatimonadaceae bacterium]|nr:MCE family protein [Gemmatimonadaceae bacterium]
MKGRDEVIVGVFVTFALIAGLVGTLWLARRGFGKSYPMYARFEWGSNLKVGQQVLLAGVQVGYVDEVELNPAGYLDVTLAIDKGRQIPEGTTAVVQNEGFFGDKSVGLLPCRMPTARLGNDVGTRPPAAPQASRQMPGDRPVCRPGAFLPAGDTIPAGKPAPSMDQILTTVDSMSGALSDVVQTVRIQMVQQGGIEDLRKTIASTNDLVRELNHVAAEQSRALALTLTSLRRTVNAIDSTALDSTVRNMAATTRNLNELTASLQTTTARLDKVMAQIETGNGTVGKLLNDPGVYNNLRQLLAQLDSLTADIKANPKKYINVKVF